MLFLGMNGRFHEVIPCRSDALVAADEALMAWLEGAGGTASVVYAVRLALEELGTNLIKYGHEQPEGHGMEVEVWAESGEWVMRVTDDGRPFNPLMAAAPRTDVGWEEREVGGMGLELIRRMFDAVVYERVEGKNRLVLRKRMDKASGDVPRGGQTC
jgi:anti-sigma regulatory factor (Ser/Thr protein kinase)